MSQPKTNRVITTLTERSLASLLNAQDSLRKARSATFTTDPLLDAIRHHIADAIDTTALLRWILTSNPSPEIPPSHYTDGPNDP